MGFVVGGRHYAFAIEHVQEVLAEVVVEPVPGAGPDVLGVVNLRGRILTVFDLHARLGLPGAGAGNCMLIVESARETVGLRVERIARLHTVIPAEVRLPPRAAGTPAVGAAVGFLPLDNGLLTLLDPARLVLRTAA